MNKIAHKVPVVELENYLQPGKKYWQQLYYDLVLTGLIRISLISIFSIAACAS